MSRWRAPQARPAAMSLMSHVLVLMIGLVLVVPVLTAHHASGAPGALAGRLPAATGIANISSRGRNAFSVADVARELVETAPSVAPAAPAAPRPPSRTARPFIPPPGSGGAGLAAIYAVFNGSPGLNWALRVAYCESRYHPNSVNSSSGATGLFQFMPATWNAHFPGWNIWDPYAQALAALDFYNHGWTSAWTCK